MIILQNPPPFPTIPWAQALPPTPTPFPAPLPGEQLIQLPELNVWGMTDTAIQTWNTLGIWASLCQGIILAGLVALAISLFVKFVRRFADDRGADK
ncbi:MAG: hypothetical protein SF162_01235 [bacterium]|nr:hypothetical protein [bacterium]